MSIEHAEVRAARPEDAEAVLETLCLAFELNLEAARPIFYADPYYDLRCKRVLVLPGVGVVSCLTVVPTTLRIGGVPIEAGGIAGVATRPAFRRRGSAAALLAATVPALWDELGYPLSLLHPVSAPFYQKLGWEYASRFLPWLAAPASLPRFAESENVRPITDLDWPAIHRLNAQLTRSGTGTCVRDSRRWQVIQMPVPGRDGFVYAENGDVQGYGFWERRDTLQVLEMHGRTLAARRGLVGFLACQQDALIEWAVSAEILQSFGLASPLTIPEPGVMVRIVDLQAALTVLHATLYAPVLAESEATLTLILTDPLCPQNTLPLRLTPGGITTHPSGTGPWLRTDIRTFGPLYLGHTTPSEAHQQGRLRCDSPATQALADRLFPARHPYIAPLDQF